MLKKSLITLSLLAAFAAQAQTTATSSPAKKELVARILKVQQPAIEGMARALVEQPAAELMSSAAQALPVRVAKDKQEAVARDIQGDIQKYMDDAVPMVQRRAVTLAPSTVGALLEERFTEDELKQIASTLENPAFTKFQRMGEDMQKTLGERLIADTRPSIEPKVLALEQSIGQRLGVAPNQQGAAPAPARKASARK
jgi:hypothetical protein